jgi:hypothetical protein
VRIGESEECGDGEENLPNYREVNPMRKNKRAHEGQDSGDNKRLRILLHKSLEPKSPEIKVIGAKGPVKQKRWTRRAQQMKSLELQSPEGTNTGAQEPRQHTQRNNTSKTKYSRFKQSKSLKSHKRINVLKGEAPQKLNSHCSLPFLRRSPRNLIDRNQTGKCFYCHVEHIDTEKLRQSTPVEDSSSDHELRDDNLTFREILNHPDLEKWMEAIHQELSTLKKRGCWEVVPTPNSSLESNVINLEISKSTKPD